MDLLVDFYGFSQFNIQAEQSKHHAGQLILVQEGK